MLRSTNLLILFEIRKNCYNSGRNLCIKKMIKLAPIIIEECLLPTAYKILSISLLSRLNVCVDEIIGGHHCRFQCHKSTTDQIFRICQILKKWECNVRVHQLFINFEKAYGLIRGEVLYNILIEFGIAMKLG
jgi:Mg2+/Co2+ transporter CorC